MALIRNAEIWFAKLDPKRPSAKMDKDNPRWEVQIRTYDKKVKDEWAKMGLRVHPVIPDEGQPYYRVNLNKKSLHKNKQTKEMEPNGPVEVLGANLQPVDPTAIGNGSIANVRVYQYQYGEERKTANVLMGVQLVKHILYKQKPREDDFTDEGETEVVKPEGYDDEETPTFNPDDDIPF